MRKPTLVLWHSQSAGGPRAARRSRVFLAIVIILALALAVAATAAWALSPVDKRQNQTQVIHIGKGSTTRAIAASLQSQKLIRSQWAFLALLIAQNNEGRLQAGDYLLGANMSLQGIIDKMIRGDVYRPSQKLTIPEGMTVTQIADTVDKLKLATRVDFLAAVEAAEGHNLPSGVIWGLEGYLFPATYDVPLGSSAADIVKLLNEQAIQRYAEIALPAGYPLSRSQAITLASMVEREAKYPEERPIIASVFFNRLKDGWKLESCATVEYLLGAPKPVLSLEDIEIDSPYNTYQHTGLPPGPVASPGMASLQAVLHPAQTDYFFFVADPDGHHIFSKTYDEHLAAVAKVQKPS